MVVATRHRPLLTPVTTVKRAALVVRVSTERQARTEEGSLSTQLQRLRQHLAYKRDACGELWEEAADYALRAVSGKHSLRSPEFARLFSDIREGKVDAVLCTALDRISRSVKDFLSFFELLNEHGVEFVCLKQHSDTTTPQGTLLVMILLALAEFERKQTAERTKEASAVRTERGLWNGGKLFGYDPDPEHRSRLVVNEDEAAVVCAAFQAYLTCGSIKETAALLNTKGYRTKAYTTKQGKYHPGGTFHLPLVQHLLKNVAYLGKREINKHYKGVAAPPGKEYRLVDAVWPASLDQETFDEVQRLMTAVGHKNHNAAAVTRHTYILAGLAVCGRCGSALENRSGTGRNTTVSFYYCCPRATCKLRVSAAEIEGAVIDRLSVLAEDGTLIQALVAETNARLQRRAPVLAKQERSVQRQLNEVKGQAAKLLEQWQGLEREHGRSFVTDRLGELGQRRTELEQTLSEVQETLKQVRTTAVTAKAVKQALGRVQEVYACLLPHEQQELISLVVRKAEVLDRELRLEVNGGICALAGQAPEKWLADARFSQGPLRLRDQDSNLEPIG